MKLLKPILKHFDRLGIFSARKFTLKSLFIFVSTASYSALSTVFLGFEASTLNEFAESFYGAATPLFIFSINVIYAFNRKCIFQLIETTEHFIDKRENSFNQSIEDENIFQILKTSIFFFFSQGLHENPLARPYYARASRRIQILATICEILIDKLTIPCVMLPQFTMSYFNYFTTDLGRHAFSLPFPMSFPFQWRSPHGYLAACLFQIAGTYAIVLTSSCNYIYDVGTCETLNAIAEDIKIETFCLHATFSTKSDQIKLQQRLSRFIALHINGIKLSLSQNFMEFIENMFDSPQFCQQIFRHL